ncbi:Pregnancy-associated glycoprotein 2 [Vanrija pseudolonga]|uniref:Pregnancy-associated glycoprotein 2 n=1 Tax=Vanrija pseudolonga TaxID=143232 RepID=A0AAF0YD23_9TREE|nr:Pregnancy-associated glycoprotein 2 [Vanrija pseudolonga]
MGWSRYGTSSPFSLWMRLVSGWKDQRFGIYLAKQKLPLGQELSDSDPNGGVLTLGGVNTKLFTGDINYVPLSKRASPNVTVREWGIDVDGVEIGSNQFPGGTYALIDTGAPVSYVHQDVYKAVYANVSGLKHYLSRSGYAYDLFPCASMAGLPPLVLTLGGVQYSIPSEDLAIYVGNQQQGGEAVKYCRNSLEATPQEYLSQWADSNAAYGVLTLFALLRFDWILGVHFLRHVYSVWQYSPPAIGFAKLSPEAASATTSATGSGVAGGGSATTAPSSTATKAPSGASSKAAGLSVMAIGVVLAVLA